MSAVAENLSPGALRDDAVPGSLGADAWLVGSVLTLLTFGLVMVYSATVASGDKTLAFNFIPVTNHLVHILMGVLLMVALRYTPLHWWENAGCSGFLRPPC